MRRGSMILVGVTMLTTVLAGIFSATGSAAPRPTDAQRAWSFWQAHGYLPVDGIDSYYRQKAAAAAKVAAQHGQPAQPATGADPTIGAAWQGIASTQFTPPDANGAIGPSSYLEIINANIAIYTRTGSLTATSTLNTLTGDTGQLSDPMILWDADTQRFYYNVWNVNDNNMDWGFSKTSNPTTIPGSFCNYSTAFGYSVGTFPDYPKLGQSKRFLMIGINFYPTITSQHATQSDLLWIQKPQGRDPVTTCPPASDFNTGKFEDLRNQDGTQAWTPVPAIQADPSNNGFVVTSADIECPDICGTGTLITVHAVRPTPGNPSVAQLSHPSSIRVPGFEAPADAPQQGSSFKLDTLDGRLEHAVMANDPRLGTAAIWTGHAVVGGAGAEFRWYEISPVPLGHPTLRQSGTVSSASLYVFNGSVSPDRVVSPAGRAFGDSMVAGVSTSSATTFPAIQMVSKIGAGAQSGMVMVKQSTTSDLDFGCAQLGFCRWGDYAGATPDPAASLTGAHGEVWLTNQWVNPNDATWNWEARP